MHILGESTDERVVNFGDAGHLLEGASLHRIANPVQHEPRRLLSDTERPSKFVGRDAVLAVGDEPNSRKPLVEPERGILEDSSDLERELLLAALALPNLAGGDERGVAMPATGADDLAIRPAEIQNEVERPIGIREVVG